MLTEKVSSTVVAASTSSSELLYSVYFIYEFVWLQRT